MALTDKLTAIADAIRAKTGKTDGLTLAQMPGEIADIQTGSNIPDGTGVTFGNVDGEPVEREEAYVIASDNLNKLGAIAQMAGGVASPMTVSEMIFILDKGKFMPCGNAASAIILPLAVESSAAGLLQEG